MDSTGVQQAKYVNGANTDEPLCLINSLGTHYYHQDGHNNVISLTNVGGALEESYNYDVFGTFNIQDGTGNGLSVSALGNRFAYTGREYVSELGLYDYRNRIYSPQLGSFFQTDPIGFGGQDANLYRYVGNQVINGSDPQGLYITYDGGGSAADWNKWSDKFAKDYATPEGKKKWDKEYACPDEHKQYADGHEDGPGGKDQTIYDSVNISIPLGLVTLTGSMGTYQRGDEKGAFLTGGAGPGFDPSLSYTHGSVDGSLGGHFYNLTGGGLNLTGTLHLNDLYQTVGGGLGPSLGFPVGASFTESQTILFPNSGQTYTPDPNYYFKP